MFVEWRWPPPLNKHKCEKIDEFAMEYKDENVEIKFINVTLLVLAF